MRLEVREIILGAALGFLILIASTYVNEVIFGQESFERVLSRCERENIFIAGNKAYQCRKTVRR